jgi:hypothetical protein
MKRGVLALLLLPIGYTACSSKEHQVESAQKIENQVLIEFAARMEEDYHRFHPESKDIGALYPESHTHAHSQETPSEAKPASPQDAQ